MNKNNNKITGILLLLLLICLSFSGCHRKTNVYQDAFDINKSIATNIDATTQNQENTTSGHNKVQKDTPATEDSADIEKQAAQEEEEAFANSPKFLVSVKQFLDYFKEQDYDIEVDEQEGADAYRMYNIKSGDFITITINGTDSEQLDVIYVTTDVRDVDTLMKNPTQFESFLSVMKDIHTAIKANYDEEAMKTFVKDTDKLNGMTQVFDMTQMYSQYYMNQYYITIQPKDEQNESN